MDLAAPEGVEQLYQRIRAHGDQLEAVALNAGIGMGGDSPRRPISIRS